jgi:hypothetical protein
MRRSAVTPIRAGAVRAGAALLWLAAFASVPAVGQDRRCQLQIDNVDREGVRANVTPTATNYFAGGNVRMRCRGENVRIWTDSVASYQGQIVQFVGHFRYEDETANVTSDFGTYYKDNERWEAQGNVVYVNQRDGSKLTGPNARYLRRIKGTRDLEEVMADQRPTLTLASKDSLNRQQEPYVVVADRIHLLGEDRMWAGGTVTIDRSDLRGRGDSLALDTGRGNSGLLLGHASIRRAAADSFALAAKRIDLALAKKELIGVTGRDSATLTSKELDLTAQAIALRLEARKVVQTLAWGETPRPRALSDDYEVRGDSLAIDTPAETLKEMRAFQHAWVGFKPDTSKGERVWLAGDKVVASFTERPTATGKKSALRQLEATNSAQSFYRVSNANAPNGRPSINYSRADRILLIMQVGDSLKVERVEMVGKVDGVQLEPEAARRDTVRTDTTATRPKKP